MSSNTICVGDKVKVIGKHRFLKSDVEYTVSSVDGDYVALEGLDYGCAWHVSNFIVTNVDPSKFNPFKVGDRVDFISRSHHWFGGVYDNLEVTAVYGEYIDVKRSGGNKSVGWYHKQFKLHVSCKFTKGDRVDFINPMLFPAYWL